MADCPRTRFSLRSKLAAPGWGYCEWDEGVAQLARARLASVPPTVGAVNEKREDQLQVEITCGK
ncbi:unnamed protein product [Clonostachys solani]|uniref:Uncharacterized protein n=1 Tax=Clonostachys solani TaxID=160281 RepID=A0A9N9ZC25_9HYPO|nr:unnamed protein product [Clonostachys solani]